MLVTLSGAGPLARRIYEGLRHAIHEGRLGPGERLPSTRRLAADLGVSRTTVIDAFEQLLAEGYVTGKRGSGTYVAAELPERSLRALGAEPGAEAAEPLSVPPTRFSAYGERLRQIPQLRPRQRTGLLFDFAYGAPAMDDFPHETWMRLFQRVVRAVPHEAFLYGEPEGDDRLRAEIAGYLARARAVRCRPEQVLIVNGSQQALDLAARVLVEPGDPVVIENPHYQGARNAFLSAGARLVPSDVDDAGLVPARFSKDAHAARLAYVTPSHQFPTGVTMSLARRLELLRWAEERGAHLLEDDYDSEFRYEGRPIESLQGLDRTGRVIYVGTFSKVLYPALRVGYMVLPEELIEPFVKAKWLADRQTPALEQKALAEFLAGGHFERHLRRSRTRNSARRAALLDALERHFGDRVTVQGENAGIHLVVWFRERPGEPFDAAIERAAAAGISVHSVAPYYLGDPPGDGLLIGFSNMTPETIERGIAELARLFDRG